MDYIPLSDNAARQVIDSTTIFDEFVRVKARDSLERLVGRLVDEVTVDTDMPERCRALSARLFAPEAVVKQITAALAR
ncbi:MAG: hypothetical protein JJD98_11325 [Polaromonas sp.]|nr:hypothetical protein [Polaromonas sp.]